MTQTHLLKRNQTKLEHPHWGFRQQLLQASWISPKSSEPIRACNGSVQVIAEKTESNRKKWAIFLHIGLLILTYILWFLPRKTKCKTWTLMKGATAYMEEGNKNQKSVVRKTFSQWEEG